MTQQDTSQSGNQGHFSHLLAELEKRRDLVRDYLLNSEYVRRFRPDHIRDAALSYVRMGGKSLRAAVLLLSCGAVGGDEAIALPAAAAVEIYHTWTLVHDDVIDKDDTRRGTATVHTEFARRASADFGWQGADAEHYGLTIAILTGDIQQAWSWSLLFELSTRNGVAPGLVLQLASELANYVQPTLVEGETLDVQFSSSFKTLPEDTVIDMLWKKTGALYEFAGRAGAAVGLNDPDPGHPLVRAIAKFCSACGTAFQIQDDILGIVGDERRLGKPVGSDIREGKITLLTLKALELATPSEKETIRAALGKRSATPAEITKAADTFRRLRVIEYARQIARDYVNDGLAQLAIVPDSDYKALLQQWAEYLIKREF